MAARAFWKPRKQTPDEWGAAKRIYPPGTGRPGPRDPSIAPYALAFGRAFQSRGQYRRVVLVTAAQSGKTEAIMDVIGERLDNRPAPVLYVGPSKQFVVEQFEPRLKDMLAQALSRKMIGGVDGKRQTKTLKRVNGVRLRLAHAGSSTALKSDPAAIALVDEYDEMVKNVRGQGDPLGLVEARGDTYADFITGITSTPSVGMVEIEHDDATGLDFWKVAEPDIVKSPIWSLWQEGTRHHWCWRCIHCEQWFVPRFTCLSWPKDATPAQARREAIVKCPNCGGIHDDAHKQMLNANGMYVAPGQTIEADGTLTGSPADVATLSFWVSGLASPFVTFGQRAETYLTAFRSRESAKIQTAVNAQFGEVYTEGGGELPPWEELLSRRMPYRFDEVPDGARYLTFGGDVQKNRIPFVVRAWGPKLTSWLIRHGEFYGDTSQLEIWNDLAQFLAEPIGGRLIKIAFIDSGFRPGKKISVPVHRVYEFARQHRRFVFATKGRSFPTSRPIVQSKIEVEAHGTVNKYGLDLMQLDPDHWKSFVHERLSWPQDQPGAWLYPQDTTEAYCKQLVAEVRVIGPNLKPQWIERSRENHYLDAEAMAAAAAHLLNLQYLQGGQDDVERERVVVTVPPEATGDASSASVGPPQIAKGRKEKKTFRDLAARLNE